MRILIISQWYPPEPARLLEELAATFGDLGHEVEVLTGFPNYPAGRIYPGYKLHLWRREILKGIPLIRVALYPDHSHSAVGRLLNYGSFALSAAVLGPMLASPCDIVYVYGSPATTGLPGWWISRLRRVPFVFLVPDLWPEAFEAVGVRSRFILHSIGVFAKWVYRRAARIITVTDAFRRNLIGKGVPEQKVEMITTWVDVDNYRPIEAAEETQRQLGITRPIVIMYAGQIGLTQGLATVVDAAEILRDRDDIEFVLLGDGVARPVLQQKARSLGLTNVRFVGPFPSGEMSRLYSAASALVVHLTDNSLFRMWIPHKIWAYMAVGKPILCAVAGETADVVRAAGAGLVCDPDRPDQLADLVRAFADLTDEERGEMSRRARTAAETQYAMRPLIARNATVLLAASEEYRKS